MLRATGYLIFLSAILLITGSLIAGRQGLLVGFILSFALVILAYFYSERLILWTYSARPLEGFDPYNLYKVIDSLSKKTGLPKPRLYLIPAAAPNAMALGRTASTSSIILTEGAIQHLNPEELQAVLAHAYARIQNRDTAIGEFSAALGSIIMYVGDFFRWLISLLKLDALGKLVAGLFAPFSALLVRLGLRKNRIFASDLIASEIIANPNALAQALWKMENYGQAIPLTATLPTAHIFMINPLEKRGLNRLFFTHPIVEERIKRLIGRVP